MSGALHAMILASPLTGGGKLPCRALTTRQVNGERTFSKFHSALGRPQLGIRAFSLLKVPSSAFTIKTPIKTLLNYYTRNNHWPASCLPSWWSDDTMVRAHFISLPLFSWDDLKIAQRWRRLRDTSPGAVCGAWRRPRRPRCSGPCRPRV